MSDQFDIAGAGASIDFTVGDVACKLRPITVADQFDFEQWIRGMAIEALAESNLSLADKTNATIQLMGIGWFSDACITATGTVMGKSRLLWLATRDSHTMGFKQFAGTITEEQLHAGDRLLVEISWGSSKKKTGTPDIPDGG